MGSTGVWIGGVWIVATHPVPGMIQDTGQLTTLTAWPGVRNVTGVQSTVTLPIGIRRRRRWPRW